MQRVNWRHGACLAAVTLLLVLLLQDVDGQTPQTCWTISVAEHELLPGDNNHDGNVYTRPTRSTELGGGLVLLSLTRQLVAYSVLSRRRVWVHTWAPLSEVMVDGDVFNYPYRQDFAAPLALDEAAGLAYLGAGDRVLYALDILTGTLVWSYRATQAFESVVSYNGAGRVFLSTEDYKQIALNGSTGEVLWQLQFRRLSSPQTGVFGDVVVRPEQSGVVWGINAANGKVLWLSDLKKRRAAIVNFFEDMPYDPETNRVFISDDAGYLYALDLRTGALAWEALVDGQSVFRRLSNVAYVGDGRVLVAVGINPELDKGLNAKLVAYNTTDGSLLWVNEGQFLRSCVFAGVQVLPSQESALMAVLTSFGGYKDEFGYFAYRYADGAPASWSLPMGQRTCASNTQYLPDSNLLVLSTLSETNRALQLTVVPADLGTTCPPQPEDELEPSSPEADGGGAALPPPPPSPPAPPPPPPPRRPRGPDYCWSAQLSLLPLADPATDGERVYATDNRGVVMAVDIKTGEMLWRSAACALDAFWPSSPLVAGGAVYLVCATSHMVGINATTGRLLWRSRKLCLNKVVDPSAGTTEVRLCSSYGSYGHLDYSAELGLVYVGAPDRSYYAFDALTGKIVWNHYEGPTYLAFGSSVGLYGGALYAVSRTLSDSGSDSGMKLLAMDAANGSVIWSREFDQTLRDNGPLLFVNGTLAVGTSGGVLRLFSVGDQGGDLLWSLAVTNQFIYGVERDGDTIYFGDAAGWVRAVSLSNASNPVLWEVNTMELPELDGIPVPLNVIQPRPVYSNGRLYVTCVAGLLVLDAATGKVLWADLSQRSLASPLVIERPEGPQVVWGQYLDRIVSVGPACRPNGRGQATLAFTNSPPPPPSLRPPPSPRSPPPPPPPSPAPSPVPLDPSPSSRPSSSPPQQSGDGVVPSSSPPPRASPSPIITTSPSPQSSPPPSGSVLHGNGTRPATCPVCPTFSPANCSAARAPTANSKPAVAAATATARVSLLLSGVSGKALKADTRAQDALAEAVRRAAVAPAADDGGRRVDGSNSSLLRVEFQSVSASSGSSSTVVVRLKLEAAGGSSTSAASAAKRLVGDAVLTLQDAALVDGSSSSSSKKSGSMRPHLSALQVAVGKAGARHAVLSHANVRSLVAVMVD